MKTGNETREKPPVDVDGAGHGDQVRQLRLHGFLRELVREEGRMEAAELLGVNYKTLVRAVESGHLTTRMSHALERLLLSGESPGGDEGGDRVEELAGRLERLERGMEALAEELRDGLEELRGAVPAGVGMRAVGRDAVRAPARGRGAAPESEPVIGLRAGHGRFRGDMVAEEPASGGEERYGKAWPLVEEWRRLRKDHPHGGKGLPWLATEERLLTLELAMLEEHGLTLPPETRPLRGAGRVVQTDWRRTALADVRRARVRGEVRRSVRRVVVFGLLLALTASAVLSEGCGAAAALT